MAWDPAGAIRRELLPGEGLRWLGRQSRASQAARAVPAIAIGVLFMALSAGGISVMLAAAHPDAFEVTLAVLFALFSLLGLVLAAVGVMVSVGLLPVAYAVTDRRVLIVRDGVWRKVSQFTPQDIVAVHKTERPDGSGGLVFRLQTEAPEKSQRRQRLGLFGLSDVSAAKAAIEALRGVP
jgi:hypothetical protein